MSNFIEVAVKRGLIDAAGAKIARNIREDLGIKRIKDVKVVDVYATDARLGKRQLEIIAREALSDRIVDEYSINSSVIRDKNAYTIVVGFKPGVTDNVGRTARESIEDIIGRVFSGEQTVHTSKKYVLSGRLNKRELERIASSLHNGLIQRYSIGRSNARLDIPNVRIKHEPEAREITIDLDNKEFMDYAQNILALNPKEIKAIDGYFKDSEVVAERKRFGLNDKPTDCELELIAGLNSEHCKHKIFNAKVTYIEDGKVEIINSLFDTYIKRAVEKIKRKNKDIVSVLWDNAGAFRFDEDHLIYLKGETHNSPSAMEPFGGAETGIVGVYRDILGAGLGAKLISGMYGFFTGDPKYNGKLRLRIHPKVLLEGIRSGVESGGNKSGVPTVNGIVYFDNSFLPKPLVYVIAEGIIPAKIKGKPSYKKKTEDGDLIVTLGGRVGIDGLHGATASSRQADEHTPAGHVQIGAPFSQKLTSDFLLEARDLGYIRFDTDSGALGLGSAVGESARYSNGCEVELDKVPLKYHGLDPWQIVVSESQERMVVATDKKHEDKFFDLARRRNVEATVIGRYTNSGKFHAAYNGKTCAYIDMDFLHKGFPQMELTAEWIRPEHRGCREVNLPRKQDYTKDLLRLLSSKNLSSREYIVRQFDHEVQGGSVIKPLAGKDLDVHNDAVVIRPKLDSYRGLAKALSANPDFGKIDTYHMAANSIDEVIRRVISVGAKPGKVYLNDNFCWPSPLKDRYKMAQLVRACKALYDYTTAFNAGCIAGKDSMSVDGKLVDDKGKEHFISGLPTLLFSASAIVEDFRKCITMDAKIRGDLVYVLGLTKDDLGGSGYYKMHNITGLNVPKVDAKAAIRLYDGMYRAIRNELVASCHAVQKGGLALALAKTAFAGGLGMSVDLNKVPSRACDDYRTLFSESASRFVVTIDPKNKRSFEDFFRNSYCANIGSVVDNGEFLVQNKGRAIIENGIEELKKAYKTDFD